MKNRLTVICICILMLLLSSCAKSPIRIGFTGNLTGTGSELGTNAMYGAFLAVDEVNAEGGINGHPVELVIEDDGNDINTAVDADKELIEEGVSGIIGHLLSNNVQLSVPYINENKILMISPTISSVAYSGKDDYFFSLMPVSAYQSEAISNTVKAHGHKKVGLLYQAANKVFSKAVVDDFKSYYEDSGHTVVFYNSFDTEDQQAYSSLIDELKSLDAEALVIIGTGYDLAKFTQSFALSDINFPTYTAVWAMTNELLVNAGPTANGLYLVNYYDANHDSEAFKSFHKAYLDKYGNPPAFGALFSYEATKVLLDGIASADSTDADEIKASILEKGTYQGLQSLIEFNQYGDVKRDIFLFQVIDESYVKVTE